MPGMRLVEDAHRNGHEVGAAETAPGRSDGSLFGRALRSVAGLVTNQIPHADLDERDSDFIREHLPSLWLLASLWFRGEVRGLGNIPDDGPVLLVGNHSGGNLIPDTIVFTVAFSTYSASSAPSTSWPTTLCCRCRTWLGCAGSGRSLRLAPMRGRRST